LNQINLNEYHVVNSLEIQGKHENSLKLEHTHVPYFSIFFLCVENLTKDRVNLNNKGKEFTPK
jgi:hypothetical protein